MANSLTLTKLCALLLCIIVGTKFVQGAINCGVTTQNLAPCIGFLESGQGPSAACCRGVRVVKELATAVEDRRTACRCMKAAAAAFPGINHKNSAELPSKCGVNIPGVVGPQTDCSKVQ